MKDECAAYAQSDDSQSHHVECHTALFQGAEEAGTHLES